MAPQKLIKERLNDYLLRNQSEAETVERFITLVDQHVDCFERTCWAGHITGSSWVVNQAGTHVLLTHHRKLNRWLQPGGHSDGQHDTLEVALREAEEETGMRVQPVWDHIVDLDIHEIPARKSDPAHLHFDVRFALKTIGSELFVVSEESHDLAWVGMDDLENYTREWSVLRLREKWRAANPL